MTTVNLDDVERNAKAHAAHRSCCNRTHMEISPKVVLALVARIRELHTFLSEAVGSPGDCGGLPLYLRDEATALLEKGIEIP